MTSRKALPTSGFSARGHPIASEPDPIIFYDGVCGLCDGLVQFVLQHDERAVFRFAPLQGTLAGTALPPHGKDPADLSSVYVLIGRGMERERVLERAQAVLYVLQRLGWPWRVLSVPVVLPAPLLDLGYRLVARCRYHLFGRYEACPVQVPRWRERFID